MSLMGGSGRRRGRAVTAVLLALCVAAPELGGVAAAATSSARAGSSASEPTNVVLVAKRRTRSQVERARFRAYLRRHPNVLKRQAKRHPGAFRRKVIRKVRLASGKPVPRPARARRGAYAGAKAKNKKKAAARKKQQQRRRRAAIVGAGAAGKRRGQNQAARNNRGGGDSLGWSDWLAIGLLVLAPFAAVALLLYITDLRRRPRAPSRSRRRRSLVITPHKS
jgi:hypothetical protein